MEKKNFFADRQAVTLIELFVLHRISIITTEPFPRTFVTRQASSLLPREPEHSSVTSSEEHFLEEGTGWSASRLNNLWRNSHLKLRGKAELNHRGSDLRRVHAPCTDCMKGVAVVTTVIRQSISTSHSKRPSNPNVQSGFVLNLFFSEKSFPLDSIPAALLHQLC